MQPSGFTKLPVLERIKQITAKPLALKEIAIVSVQHLLHTTGSLFQAFIDLGCRPSDIHLLGKLYSANDTVADGLKSLGVKVYPCSRTFPWGEYDSQLGSDVEQMWVAAEKDIRARKLNRIIVLDDGGYAIAAIPRSLQNDCSIIAVEQTMSGLQKASHGAVNFQVIQVASSAAKKFVEPPIIADAVFSRVDAWAASTVGGVSGVVGAGSIGQAIARALKGRGHRVAVYERERELDLGIAGIDIHQSLEELWAVSDTLWGCTGDDILEALTFWQSMSGIRILVSCSSSDREFRAALRRLNESPEFEHVSRLEDVTLQLPHGTLQIRNGGFPVNFDGSPESAPGADIQVTRGLLLAAVLQAVDGENFHDGLLSPTMQSEIVQEWLRVQPHRRAWYADDLLNSFKDIGWIAQHSGSRIGKSSVSNEYPRYWLMPSEQALRRPQEKGCRSRAVRL